MYQRMYQPRLSKETVQMPKEMKALIYSVYTNVIPNECHTNDLQRVILKPGLHEPQLQDE